MGLLSLIWVLGACTSQAAFPPLPAIESACWIAAKEELPAPSGCPMEPDFRSVALDGRIMGSCGLPAQWQAYHSLHLQSPDSRFIDAQERLLFNAWAAEYGHILPSADIGYLERDTALYALHFVPFSIQDTLSGVPFNLRLETNFPADGRMRWTLEVAEPLTFSFYLRIPAWADNQPSPNPRFRYWNKTNRKLTLSVDDEWVFPSLHQGYARLSRSWTGRHTIELELPLSARKIITQDPLTQVDSFALSWGPILYALPPTEIPEGGYGPEARWERPRGRSCTSALMFQSPETTPSDSISPYATLGSQGGLFLPVHP